MPYIAPELRANLDPSIEALADRLAQEAQAAGDPGAMAGLLNYTCTSLALKAARRRFGPLRYWLIALISGVFQNIAQEFYRRLAAPYEERQIAQSGDLDIYEEYLQEMKEA